MIHQISTPLTNCLCLLENYLEKSSSSTEELLLAQKELIKAVTLLKNRQTKNLSQKYFSPTKILEQIIQSYKKPYYLKIHFQNWSTPIECYGKEEIFAEIILHLLNNACEAYAPLCCQREISVTLIKTKLGFGVVIGDGGTGISWWQRLLIGNKNISFKPIKSGLGLHQVRQLLKKEFAGKIDFISHKNIGTWVVLSFPC